MDLAGRKKSMAKKSSQPGRRRSVGALPVSAAQLDARPDPIDFRDLMFEPTLVEVPLRITLNDYRSHYPRKTVPILDQGQEGACTGFGLAAVAHFLLNRRKVVPDPTRVSPRMIYEMARRYDEWPGEDYSGSSARGAMKGWHKHGICSERVWPYKSEDAEGVLNHERAQDAAARPLGAYLRVNHRNLVAMHAALAEVGVLYATGTVHEGWTGVDKKTGLIPGPEGKKVLGGHAFAIVGYDQHGFWIQNSWSKTWGKQGFAMITYGDWLTNGTDAWVARLGAAVEMPDAGFVAVTSDLVHSRLDLSFSELRPHVIGIGNNGALRPTGEIGTKPEDLDTLFLEDFPRITKGWTKKRILLYAHGGLVAEKGALQRVAGYREGLLNAEVYPLAFIWKTDFWTTVTNLLRDALNQRRPEGVLDATKDFMLDRLDDTLELVARPIGKPIWSEMKENAAKAMSEIDGGARLVLAKLTALLESDPAIELHVAGHSAGSIFMAPIVAALEGGGLPIRTCTLWAPACTMKLFAATYLPAVRSKTIEHFNLFTMKDGTEQADDCAKIYHKSLLYLVSNSFEDQMRVPLVRDGEPLLGMEKFILADPAFAVDAAEVRRTNPPTVPLFGSNNAIWIRTPNGLPVGSPDASEARHHGDFDDDERTVKATLARILNASPSSAEFNFAPSVSALAGRRRALDNSLVR